MLGAAFGRNKNKAGVRRAIYTNDYTPIYLTYYLVFPKKAGGDTWCKQVEFQNHDDSKLVSWEIDQMVFPIDVKNKLKHKKEADWKDHNGVEHRLVIEHVVRPTVGNWGVKR